MVNKNLVLFENLVLFDIVNIDPDKNFIFKDNCEYIT